MIKQSVIVSYLYLFLVINGQTWDLDLSYGGVYVLPPYATADSSEWYKGTANAIYQNIKFIERYDPDNVLILSGDHIYRMDYAKMIKYHEEHDADITIAVRKVPMEEASRFGIMNTNPDGSIYEFEEKPKQPKSNNASMAKGPSVANSKAYACSNARE